MQWTEVVVTSVVGAMANGRRKGRDGNLISQVS